MLERIAWRRNAARRFAPIAPRLHLQGVAGVPRGTKNRDEALGGASAAPIRAQATPRRGAGTVAPEGTEGK